MNPTDFVNYILSLQADDPLQSFQFHLTFCNTITVLELWFRFNPNSPNHAANYLLVGRLFATEPILAQIMPHLTSLANATISFTV